MCPVSVSNIHLNVFIVLSSGGGSALWWWIMRSKLLNMNQLKPHNVIFPFQDAFLNVKHPFLPNPITALYSAWTLSTHSLWLSESSLMNRITEFNPLTYFRLLISCNDNVLTSCCIGLTLDSCEEPQNVKVLWGPEETMKKRKWWGDSDTHADIPGQPSIMITRLSFGLGKTHPFDDQATVQAWPLFGHLPGLMSGAEHELLWSLNTDDADWNAETWTTWALNWNRNG